MLFVFAFGLGFVAPVLDLLGVMETVAFLGALPFRILGLALFGLGLVGTLVAQLAMGDSWRIGVDESERTGLVTAGPFAVVRNPIFAAMIPTSLGFALLVPNVVALAAFLALVAELQLQVRLVEEPHLMRAHGERYLAYASRAHNWVTPGGPIVELPRGALCWPEARLGGRGHGRLLGRDVRPWMGLEALEGDGR